ncbi:hypothetical protein [Rheinheimera sp. MM224]|uniref:hypothetical protein n=1 Tax=Rheinheimera sp. MM224 TaxID=3019969 RepID=UPI0021F83E9D|nr:hypothetical protein [Rheinheimera sp. MM224]CAI3791036.1 hypothetical protein JAMGFMIE_00192 [Rheinheimera sp. MM224]
MRELTFEQVEDVSGGHIGEVTAGAAVTGGLAGGAAGWNVARAAGHGAMRGAVFGFAGILGGAMLFGGIAYVSYYLAS